MNMTYLPKVWQMAAFAPYTVSVVCITECRTDSKHRGYSSDVNKDLTLKAKDKDKDQTLKAKDQDKD